MVCLLTLKQIEVLNAIDNFIKDKKYPPTVRELCKIIGVNSTSTIHTHITLLQEKEYITREYSIPRSIRILKEVSSL